MEAANQVAAYISKLDLWSQQPIRWIIIYSGRLSLINTRCRSKDLECLNDTFFKTNTTYVFSRHCAHSGMSHPRTHQDTEPDREADQVYVPDGHTRIRTTNPQADPLYGYFQAVAGQDQEIDRVELQRCLTASGISGSYQTFSKKTCGILIAMLDRLVKYSTTLSYMSLLGAAGTTVLDS